MSSDPAPAGTARAAPSLDGTAEPPSLPRRMTDPVPVVLAGSAVWLVAGLVLGGLALNGSVPLGVWFWAAACGFALGAIGLGVLGLQRRAHWRGAKGAQKL